MLIFSATANLCSRGLSTRTKQYILLLVLVVHDCCGHLVLTYPPARQYQLDFLDNARTQGPCGMPKDPDLVSYTDIPTGSQLDLQWHVAYPHRGGVYAELRASNNSILKRYPDTGFTLADDVTLLKYQIQLPSYDCEGCYIRMVKAAIEWGPNYLFWSCADINAVSTPMSNRERCSNQGMYDGSMCVCDRLYAGELCQFKNECDEDSDCGSHGQCVDTMSTRYPKLQCYCSAGWFGRQCERESSVKSKSEIDLTNYKRRELTEGYSVYHRILQDTQEIEVVMEAETSTWVALGWRSQKARASCQKFPVESDVQVTPEPNSEGNAGTGEPTAEGEHTGTGEPHPEGETVTSEPNPEGESVTGEPHPEGETVTSEPHPEGESVTSEPHPEGESVTSEPHPEGESVTSEPHPEGESVTSEPHPEGESVTSEPHPEGETVTSEPHAEGENTGPTGEPEPESEPNPCDGSCNSTSGCLYDVMWTHDAATQAVTFTVKVSLTSDQYFGLGFSLNQLMPDSDIVVGWVRDNGSTYLSDRWATAKSRPSPDNSNDLKLVSGESLNGVTTVSFSRMLDTDDAADLPLNATACIYLLTSVGPKNPDDTFSHHSNRGISTEKYCFTSCPAEPTPEAETEAEAEAEPGAEKEPDTGAESEAESAAAGHPMDCIDVVVGGAKGELSRIGDYYTRDRSTPLFDEAYGGVDSLTAALGYEENGKTTILFRKSLTSTDPADWDIEDSLMHVAWARGQDRNQVYHNPPSAIERNMTSDKDYYKLDELKYHGTSANQRGSTSFNFFQEADGMKPETDCSSGGCTDPNSCPYSLAWTYDATDKSVTFEITANLDDNQWVALGISNDNFMPATDVIAAYFQDGTPMVSDRYATARSAPQPDSTSNVQLINGNRENGVATFTFKRPADTGDARDVSLHGSGGECPYLFYGVGGTVDSDGGMKKHPNTPFRAGRVCFGVCTATDPVVIFLVGGSVRFQNLTYSEDYKNLQSAAAKAIKLQIENGLNSVLPSKIKDFEFKRAVVTALRQGSVIAEFDVHVQAKTSERNQVRDEVEAALKDAVSTGSVGNMAVDPQSLTVSEPSIAQDAVDDGGDNGLGEAEIIIIAVAVAFVFVALCVVLYKVWEMRQAKSADKKRLSNSHSSSDSYNGHNSMTASYNEIQNGKQHQRKNVSSSYMHEPYHQPAYDNPGYQTPQNKNMTTYIP